MPINFRHTGGHNRLPLYYLGLIGWLLLFTFTACDTTVQTDEAQVGEAIVKEETVTAPKEVYTIDTAKSEITWIGAKVTGRHNGLFGIRSGELYMRNGLLGGGEVIIDMATLRSNDKSIDLASNQKLTAHLRSADFFDTEQYPTAVFELTGIAPFDSTEAKPHQGTSKDSELRVNNPTHRITGNLTIKGETRSVSFPARVTLEGNVLRTRANFNIDRTKWGIVYRSDKSLGDQTIYSEVNIGLDIIATL